MAAVLEVPSVIPSIPNDPIFELLLIAGPLLAFGIIGTIGPFHEMIAPGPPTLFR